MPYLTCTMISSIDLAQYTVSHAEDQISVDCGTSQDNCEEIWKFARGLSIVQSHKPCPYLTCTMISSVDLAHYGISHAKDRISVDCGTSQDNCEEIWKLARGLSII